MEAVTAAQGKKRHKRVVNYDKGFRCSSRHGLGHLLKSKTKFDEGLKKIARKKESFNTFLSDHLDKFMSQRKISTQERRKYILHGGFPTVTRQVHTWIIEFLNYINLSALEHGWFPSPRQGPAQATLQYVSDQLWEICEDANERRDLLL